MVGYIRAVGWTATLVELLMKKLQIDTVRMEQTRTSLTVRSKLRTVECPDRNLHHVNGR